MDNPATPNRRLSWATWTAVLVAVLLLGLALRFWLPRGPRPSPTTKTAPARAWYPEPSVLLEHAEDLALTPRQLRQVQVAAREWQIQRAAFDAQFKSYGSSAAQAITEIQAGSPRKGRYGKLLGDFDLARDAAWKKGTHYLEPGQVLKIDELRRGLQTKELGRA